MPKINDILSSHVSGFVPDEEPTPHIPTITSPATRNPFLRCPIPPLGPISVDNLDQYDLKGLVPQYRVLIGN